MRAFRALIVEGFDDDDDEAFREADRCYRWAREFHKRGFNVVPRSPEKKCPAVKWTDLQERRVTDDELKDWHAKFSGGVGFITGAISSIVVVESDGPEGEAVLASFEEGHGALPETFTVHSGSGRGLHRYFRHPGFHVTTRANTSIKLDVKGDRGFCVLPPSLHKSGGRYEVVSGVKPATLPEGLLEFIEAEAAKADGLSSKPRRTPLGELSHNDLALGENTNLFKRLPVNPTNIVIIMSMLDALPDSYVSDYRHWRDVGFALHDFDDGAVGLALWKKFSNRCPDKAAETDFEARWGSFGSNYSGKKITLGSLRHRAEENGWRAPRQWDRSPEYHERGVEND
ncbi:MAG: hypothetical protein CTY15_01315 [Methylocystis sp.]|nr:MAG: hypothetical protein CTY15_01315 [Methylocystis sp.]